MDCSLQAPLSMGFSRQEYWSGLPFPSPGELPNWGIKPESSMSPASAGRFSITSTTWERDILNYIPGSSAGKESACNEGDLGSIPGLGRSPGKGNSYPLQYSGQENSIDCIVHGVANSWTLLRTFTFQHLFSSIFFKLKKDIKLFSTSYGCFDDWNESTEKLEQCLLSGIIFVLLHSCRCTFQVSTTPLKLASPALCTVAWGFSSSVGQQIGKE